MRATEFKVGDTFTTAPYRFSKEEIIDFAQKYDPQYFHIDEEAANNSFYGGLIASGLHTLGGIWSKWIELGILGEDIIGGAGVDQLNWTAPVRPGDELTAKMEVIEVRTLSDGEKGLVTLQSTVTNQQQKEVLHFKVKGIVRV